MTSLGPMQIRANDRKEERTMNQQADSQGVVVGLDGSGDSRLALRWALEEAQTSGRPVHLVHCHQVARGAADKGLAAWGRRLLDEGLELCREYPDVRVTAEVVDTHDPSPAASLLAAAEAAEALVVGCRGHRSPLGVLWGSVSESLSRQATCPVVTVRLLHDPEATRVVLGLTVPEPTEGALAYAFEYASHHRVGLTAINVWHQHGVSGAGAVYPVEHYVALEPDRRLGALNDALEPWRAKFPDVMVTAESIGGHAASVLRYASEHAALLVVGRPEKGGISQLLGSMSQSMLHHAQCPVAIVGLTTRAVRSPARTPTSHPVSDL
jgi:Universal stress protein UspA and related nucleotide-binding proteins